MGTTPKFAHVVLQTSKLEEMRDWYCALLKGHVVYEGSATGKGRALVIHPGVEGRMPGRFQGARSSARLVRHGAKLHRGRTGHTDVWDGRAHGAEPVVQRGPVPHSALGDPVRAGSGDKQASPRLGVQTGRFAFFDLATNSHWGGLMTGDEIELDFDGQCECGATTQHFSSRVSRLSEKRGGDDKISCIATPQAYEEAMEFLVG